MLKELKTESIEYNKLTPEEMQARGILGYLTGPCCDIQNPTRNGRKYSETLWNKVFDSPLVKEQFEAGGIFGELTHPDREEVDMEKVAVIMPEPPSKGKDGLLLGKWDILDTPCGRILKTLCDYGYKVGISTRGSGDTFTDYDGQESVDPDSYTLNALDIVLIPAVKAARLNYMTESLNTKKLLKESLQDIIKEASDNDKKVMEETLDELDIDLEDEPTEENPSTDLDIDEVSDDNEVDNTESILEELQTSLKQNRQLEQKIISLNEKLSVCYAKEEKYNEQLDKYKKRISKLSESSNKESALKKRVEKLNEELASKDSDIQSLNSRIDSLNKGIIKQKSSSKSLNEELNQRDDSIKELNENVNELKSLLEKQKKVSNKEISALNETIANLKKDLQQNKVSYSKKLEHSNKLVEKYKRVTNNVVNKYIDSQASKLGISSNEIKNRLPESYSISDIDKVCENMRDYKLNISKLPFNTMHSSKLNENVKLKAKPSTNELLDMSNDDDVVDDQLLSFLK